MLAVLTGCRGEENTDVESVGQRRAEAGDPEGGAGTWMATGDALDASEQLTGEWNVMYGAPATVTIVRTGDEFEMFATGEIQVTGSECSLPSGTLIARFHGDRSPYEGEHGLWRTADCAFQQWKAVRFELDGNTLTTELNAVQKTVTFLRVELVLGGGSRSHVLDSHTVEPWSFAS